MQQHPFEHKQLTQHILKLDTQAVTEVAEDAHVEETVIIDNVQVEKQPYALLETNPATSDLAITDSDTPTSSPISQLRPNEWEGKEAEQQKKQDGMRQEESQKQKEQQQDELKKQQQEEVRKVKKAAEAVKKAAQASRTNIVKKRTKHLRDIQTTTQIRERIMLSNLTQVNQKSESSSRPEKQRSIIKTAANASKEKWKKEDIKDQSLQLDKIVEMVEVGRTTKPRQGTVQASELSALGVGKNKSCEICEKLWFENQCCEKCEQSQGLT